MAEAHTGGASPEEHRANQGITEGLLSTAATPETAPEVTTGLSEAGRGERQAEGGFEMIIDHAKLAELIEKGQLPDTMSWLGKLPERLKFDEPVILIVGDNGAGKTMMARTITQVLKDASKGPRSMAPYNEADSPAGIIADALSLAEIPGENLLSSEISGVKLAADVRDWALQQADIIRTGNPGSADDHRLSQRQLFEQALKHVWRMKVDAHRNRVLGDENAGGAVVIFDEPEVGLAPRRQLELLNTITELGRPDDTLLVPTNNLALYLSDLPRLDLDHPERGIHKPSEYGEAGRIELHQAQSV